MGKSDEDAGETRSARRAASLLPTADENDRSIIRQRLAEYEAAVEGKDRWDLATSGSRVGTLFKTLGARLRVR
ncbi:MAG: hypothetical protein IH888_03215 [Planctomycetes bacterium]|nr:hypothetical protein [Planctomycetota bacterium]